LICAWQGFEHVRARGAARSALLDRGRDISNTVGIVLRSQGFFGVVHQPRIEAALRELTESGEPKSVVLLYASGEVAASAGEPIDLGAGSLVKEGVKWEEDTLTIVNPVDLGGGSGNENAPSAPIVLPEGERIERPPRSPDDKPRDRHRDPARSPMFGRPPWLDEQQYRDLLNRKGVHHFVLSLSTDDCQAAINHDLRLRLLMAGVALVAVCGLGLAWRNSEHSATLRMHLLRADEMNRNLQEMNLAAAGLAHETRNPLNIIRGSAQMVSNRDDAPGDIRETSWRIAEEVDRVTHRLNQFIAYSRPPDANPLPTDLKAVISDVARTLESDREDKEIGFDLSGPDLMVEADESLLRQVAFNLMLNAVQALQQGGAISVVVAKNSDGTATLEVRDNGPGVPESAKEEIFRPYFTTSKQGTGLGLAIVRHVVLAHGWNIAYYPAEGGGAVFRVSGIKIA
jgi:signal transduction histidine kinase